MDDLQRALTTEELLADMRWLRRFARRLLDDAADLDDVVQEAWTTALQKAPADLDRRGLRSWLAQVVRRRVFKRWRDESLRRHHEHGGARSAVTEGASELERLHAQHVLAGALIELREPHRTAVVLRYQRDLSYEEIALRLGIDPVTARKRVSRGIAWLRVRLRREMPDEAWRRALVVGASDARARPTGPGLARLLPWSAGLAALAAAFLIVRARTGPEPGDDAGGPVACGPEMLFEFGDYLGRWEPAAKDAGHGVEIEWSGKSVRFRQFEELDGRETLVSDALIGWHPREEALVFHQFMVAPVPVAFEGRAWFASKELCREYVSTALDAEFSSASAPGSVPAWRERWSPRGAECLRRIERADEDGEWRTFDEVRLQRALAGARSREPAPAAAGAPQDRSAIRGFEDYLGSWDLQGSDERVYEFSWGIEGRSVHLRELRLGGARPDPLGEALVGWHQDEHSLVFHEFAWNAMREGRVWFEGSVLCREFRAFDLDGNESRHRERFVLEGPDAWTLHAERLNGDGTWRPCDTLRAERRRTGP